MNMDHYLGITRHAASTLITAYTKEWQEHKTAAAGYNIHAKSIQEYNNKRTEVQSQGDGVDVIEALKSLCEKWSGLPAEYAALRRYEEDRLAKVPSTAVLCGGLLQIAKSGLSLLHGNPLNWPNGRSICGDTLSNIIRAARNQAMHFDEGNPKQQVKDCFSRLAAKKGAQFNLNGPAKENLSIYVIDLLNWYTIEAYENDMRSLA